MNIAGLSVTGDTTGFLSLTVPQCTLHLPLLLWINKQTLSYICTELLPVRTVLTDTTRKK